MVFIRSVCLQRSSCCSQKRLVCLTSILESGFPYSGWQSSINCFYLGLHPLLLSKNISQEVESWTVKKTTVPSVGNEGM